MCVRFKLVMFRLEMVAAILNAVNLVLKSICSGVSVYLIMSNALGNGICMPFCVICILK